MFFCALTFPWPSLQHAQQHSFSPLFGNRSHMHNSIHTRAMPLSICSDSLVDISKSTNNIQANAKWSHTICDEKLQFGSIFVYVYLYRENISGKCSLHQKFCIRKSLFLSAKEKNTFTDSNSIQAVLCFLLTYISKHYSYYHI